MKNKCLIQCAIMLLFFTTGCKKKNSGKNAEKQAVEIGNLIAVKSFAGKNRIKLSWQLPGGALVNKYTISWNNGSKSLELPVISSAAKDSVVVDGLEEGSYKFSISAFNNSGDVSYKAEINGRVYGSDYTASLKNRTAREITYNDDNNIATIKWNIAPVGMLGIGIKYDDLTAISHRVFVPALSATTVINNCPSDGELTYRASYLPEPLAIDTFYTSYETIKVNLPSPDDDDNYATMVTLQADGPGNTYQLLNSVLGGTAYEVPDCGHPVPHITEEFNSELNKNVFAFFAHVALDNDRCEATDRQRTEIKTYGPSPDKIKAFDGNEMIFKWKFRLDASFQPSSGFTHIHQIKAGDGTNDDSPLITITPRYGNPDKLEIIHTGNTSATTLGKVKIVDLAPFKGNWIEATEKIKFGAHGTYDLVLKKVSDGTVLLSYSKTDIDLWRTGATFCRPKWGIYRSLSNSVRLRDEKVVFADFAIGKK